MFPRSSVAAFMLLMALAVGPLAAPLSHGSPPADRILGGGEQPDIELSATSLLSGDVHLGGSANQSVIVSNIGTQDLNVSLAITGGSASQFFVQDPLGPFFVPPDGQVEVTLAFYPGAIGTQEASLEVQSDDPVDPLLTVSLSGNGYEANLVSLTGVPDPVSVNGSMTFTIVLDAPAGPGDVPVAITTSPTGLIAVPAEVTVPQGATQAQFQATAGPIPGTETVYALLLQLIAYDEIVIQNPTGVDHAPVRTLWLGPVVPNPVHRTSRVAFALPASARVRLRVFDLMGRIVATLAEGWFPAGRHEVPWDPAATRAGLYLVRLESLGETRTVKAAVTP